jgi:hypothetical protein
MEDRETTLTEARAAVQQSKEDGVFSHCPCCDQGVKVYPRRITSTMVRQLHQIVHARQPVKPRDIKFLSAGRDTAKMAYWGLVVQTLHGGWTATVRGRQFLYGKCAVPEIAFVYNQQCIGFSENLCTVRDRVGEKFNYDELMGVAK